MNKSLEKLRNDIDQLDDRIVELLNQRAGLAVEIGKIKQLSGEALYVPSRERDVLNRMVKRNTGPLSHAAICRIYGEIMSASLALEHHDRVFAGGATHEELSQAVMFIAGGNVDVEIHADPEALIKIFAGTKDSLLVLSDSWFLDMAASVIAAGPDIRWTGFWSIPVEGVAESSRYHVFIHRDPFNQVSRAFHICCLVSMTGNDLSGSLDCITDIPVRSAHLIPMKEDARRGILQIRMESGDHERVQELARRLSAICEAVWII